MLLIPANHKIFLGIAPVDFRRGIDGLAALCRQQWQLNPEDGHYFVFRNRRGNALKVCPVAVFSTGHAQDRRLLP